MAKVIDTLGSFVESLRPSIDRAEMMQDTMANFETLDSTIRPLYNLDNGVTFTNDLAKSIERTLNRRFADYTGELYSSIAMIIDIIADNEEKIETLIEKSFGKTILKETLDYRMINIIRYLEAIAFFNTYVMQLLPALVMQEYSPALAKAIVKPLDKREIAYVSDPVNIDSFGRVVKMLTTPLNDFIKRIDKLEGHSYDPDEWKAIRTANGRKLDPLETGLIPGLGHIFYQVGIAINGWRVAMNEKRHEDINRINLMIRALEEERDEGGDLSDERKKAIAKSIQYYTNKSSRIEQKIERFEEGV